MTSQTVLFDYTTFSPPCFFQFVTIIIQKIRFSISMILLLLAFFFSFFCFFCIFTLYCEITVLFTTLYCKKYLILQLNLTSLPLCKKTKIFKVNLLSFLKFSKNDIFILMRVNLSSFKIHSHYTTGISEPLGGWNMV